MKFIYNKTQKFKRNTNFNKKMFNLCYIWENKDWKKYSMIKWG